MSLASFADLNKIIPREWELVANRSIYRERKEQNGEDENELLSVTQDRGIIKQSEYEVKRDSSNEDKSKYKVTYPNDLVYNKMRMWQGAVGYNDYTGIVSPAYIVLVPDNNKIVPKFAYYQMKTPEYIAQSYGFSYGIVDDQNSLRYEEFRNMLTILPPKKTQQKIVNYLDKKLVKIDLFIKNKETYIEKLLERKKNVINELVTRGTDPDVQFANTSEWLQASPVSWNLKKLKYLVRPRTDNGILESHNLTKVALENIEGFSGRYIETEENFEGAGTTFYEGDVLFGKLRPYLGKAYIAEFNGQCVTDILPLVVDTLQVDREFIFYRIISTDFIDEVNSSTYGAKMPRASWKFIGNLRIPFPSVTEQRKIVSSIKSETKTLDKAVTKTRQQIDLIKEYRDSLITNAVTGQITIKE